MFVPIGSMHLSKRGNGQGTSDSGQKENAGPSTSASDHDTLSKMAKLELDEASKAQPETVSLRPELADIVISTAEIAANSPRYRRRSSTFIDGVHDLPDEKSSPMAPAQLYSTMSGRLFHSGRIAIVLVGLPARGKT